MITINYANNIISYHLEEPSCTLQRAKCEARNHLKEEFILFLYSSGWLLGFHTLIKVPISQ